jgi:hypothetical protein
MTSFTRKLYAADPVAAEEFHKAQQFEHRLAYGKHVTLAQFDSGFRKLNTSFGKRETPPTKRSNCPLNQRFCEDNGLLAHNCTLCRERY